MSDTVSTFIALVLIVPGCRAEAPSTAQRAEAPSTAQEVLDAARADVSELVSSDASMGEAPVDRRMAITVDDLPLAFFSDFSQSERKRIVSQWRDLLIRHEKLPVTGFVISENHRRQGELLDIWEAGGVTFGNHTWSHPRLQKIGLKAYLRDVTRGHETLVERLGDEATIYFRYPYLYQGITEEERSSIRSKLAELGSPYAPITVDTRDYYYARRFTKAKRSGDEALAQTIRRAWLWDLEEATERAEWRGRELFGREPPQILLIHANELNALHLSDYLGWLEERGYRFISLAEALDDDAYREIDRSLAPTGDSFWLRLRRSRQLGERATKSIRNPS